MRSFAESRGKGAAESAGSIQAGGATLVYPIMLRWAEVLEKEKALQLRYESLGSSKGVSGMIDRSFDFGCSDAPMTDQELARASEVGGKVLHIPLVIGAVVPICNLPEISKPLRFDGPRSPASTWARSAPVTMRTSGR